MSVEVHPPPSWLGRFALFAIGALCVAAVWLAVDDAERARVRRAAAEDLAAAHARRVGQLEGDLAAALLGQRDLRDLLVRRRAEEDATRAAQEEHALEVLAPMPEGVRLALAALRDLLLRSSHDLRFLRVRALADHALHDVEVFEPGRAATGGAGVLWMAGRADFRLDRESGALTILFHDGSVTRGGERAELRAGGEPLVLEGVAARDFEARLPYLIEAVGEYPGEAVSASARARLDPYSAEAWRGRLNDLLAAASTFTHYRVSEVAGLEDARFLDVVLLGHSDARVLVESAEVVRMAVVVDEVAGTVELELQGGMRRRAGGETAIPEAPDAQRILLTGLTPQAAMHTMTGMVVRR